MNLHVYTVTIDNVDTEVLSTADPDHAFKNGLNNKSIIGFLKESNKGVHPDNIVYNKAFVDRFKDVIKSAALTSDGLTNAAAKQRTGFIYIVDQRTSSQDRTEAKDILASFEVTNGMVSPDSFQFNPNYQIISTEGICQLPDEFEQALLNAIGD